MLHAFATDDFLSAVDDFDRHARRGGQQLSGISCRKGRSLPKRMRFYPELGSAPSALAVCRDLWALASAEQGQPPTTTLIAVFKGPAIHNPRQFESLMWQQLQAMHGVDAQCFDWEGAPARDAVRPVFSIGGRPWLVQGSMPVSDEAWPRIVFQSRRG